MTPKKPTSESDAEMFRAAVGTVKVLTDDRHNPPKPRPSPLPRRREQVSEFSEHDLPDSPCHAAPGFAESQYFARPGLQKRILRRLARGQMPLDAEIDLHGMTVDKARGTLLVFLDEALSYRYRCVRIIHGKGYSSAQRTPVIKGLLDRWLRLNNRVLAFCSAQPRDGGTGALYVLLKSPQSDAQRPAGD